MPPEAACPAGRCPSDRLAETGLEAKIEQAVARQVRPLREELLAAQGRAGLRDILGGIGYILGLVGLLIWWQSRRDRAPR